MNKLLENKLNDVLLKIDDKINSLKSDIEKLANENTKTTLSHSDILKDNKSQILDRKLNSFPTLIIKPKKSQNTKQTELEIHIKSSRTTKQGNMIIKCPTNEDQETLKNTAEK